MKKLFICALFLVACATDKNNRADNALRLWEGQPVNELVLAVGAPSRTFTAKSGNTVYAYERSDGETPPNYCNLFFEISSEQKIAAWQWEGNSCN